MAALLTQPPRPTEDFYSGFSSPVISDTVYVAVGKSVEKTAALLQWTFSMFPGREICLIHVHRPSPLIPTLLGKLPAARASPEIVAAFRNEEREEMDKLLSTYLMTCTRSRVKAGFIIAEAGEVQKGILNLVNLHNITKLVVGAIPDFMKGKKSSCKACHVSKHAPSFCEMWFVDKGKLIWTKQALTSVRIHPPNCQLATSFTENFRSCSLDSVQNEAECVKSSFDVLHSHSMSSSMSLNSCMGSTTLTGPSGSSTLRAKSEEEKLCIQVAELHGEVDESKDEANQELLEQKTVEDEALKAINKVKALESAYSNEMKLRIDAEDELTIAIQEQEMLLKERERISQELQRTMRNIAVLDSRAHEANRRREEVAAELKLIQASIATLRKERQKLQIQKTEAMRWLHRWKSHEQCEDENENKLFCSVEDVYEMPEFSLSDLEAATCCFSETFSIGQGGYGIVYKGEILNKTVAIKKLHLYNTQRQLEFHREVLCLGRLHHPNIVDLIGVCRESWLLVYEYLPGGSLREHLLENNINALLTWKVRAQIVADIASGILFLHSFKPKKIIHGNLKPENILLAPQNRCKISDYMDHMLTAGQAARCPSFRGCSGSSGCLYTDPETHRTGTLTHKSDIYSFGIITLQLVTGKTHGGLVGEVRRTLSRGKVESLLDFSAGEWSTYVARRLVELGLQCCELNSRERPELTLSLVKELQCMPFLEELTAPSFFLCPILRDIMHDPQVAADGFTYEGEAIREWLGNGHETSPMTNAKLSDVNLTPNHSLRLVIQDWIANLKISSG
ncbi:U-box domain-containing protein 33-like isoform X1 [Salvia splendens]|uniref:U-box domain-containing protein 33-like isoform X1 n=2 Tax=Salvia splendens TaxID=180675 RepID=UPI001C263F5B|nr:U-box domain-containing protein 33-like isoform X1 [Salvia splendens]